MWDVVKHVDGDLTNDVGKRLFSSLLTYALDDRLCRQTGGIIENSGTTV